VIGSLAMSFYPTTARSHETNQPASDARTISARATQPRLNSTGRDVELTVPVTDGLALLGDIALTVRKDDELVLPSARLLYLLSGVVNAEVLASLRRTFAGQISVGLDALNFANIAMRYDPQRIELALDIPAQHRLARSLTLSMPARGRFGEYEQPAALSAYLNIRGAIDYVDRGPETGFASPVVSLDGAMRFKDAVLESQGTLQPGANGPDFQRQGTRLVFDDLKNVLRWTAGDLRTVGRGFQSSPEIAGISVFRSYSLLQPQLIARPTGRQSFRLDRASTVEISVNDRVVRRIRLEPGPYDLRDFPVTQGIDNVRVSIQDDAGRTEVLQFNLFFDQTQLAEGLREFGFYAGVKAPLAASGPAYTHEGAFTGFYRQGISDRLTAGANLQADGRSALAGAELIISTKLGAFGANLAYSHIDVLGSGVASVFTFQSMVRSNDARWNAVNITAETWSENFGPLGTLVSRNPHTYRIGGSYSHAFSDAVYGGIDLQYAKGRGALPDSRLYRALLGWRPARSINIGAEVVYQNPSTSGTRELAVRLSLTMWLDSRASFTVDYDTRQQTARLGYQTMRGEGVGSYNAAATLERTREKSGTNAAVTYLASAAELGVSHFATFGGPSGSPSDSRTAARFATSAAFADGAISLGRPIYDSFAIITRHKSLDGAAVLLDPTPNGYIAATTVLGTATQPNLSSYSERTITIDAPDAPSGIDMGAGAFRVFPPYRSGYRLQVGSEYSISVVGRLLDIDGGMLALVAGTAVELTAPARPPIEIFTNRDGRFGIAGVKPGRWQIHMLTDPATSYVIDIVSEADGIARVGDIRPVGESDRP
jgi:outer membrane usher protein